MTEHHRRPVPLAKCYRLITHGPTILVSASHEGQRDIMAAAWNMGVDFDPPKISVVLDKASWTRRLLEASGTFVVQVPSLAQVNIVQTVGNTSGQQLSEEQGTDKFSRYDLKTFAGEQLDAPLLEGCVAWLECKLLVDANNQNEHDLFLAEVISAQADDRVFKDGHWDFTGHDQLRTLHHVAGGHYLVIGEAVQGVEIEV